MKKVKFAGMAKTRKSRVVKLLRVPLNLTNIEEIIRFMKFNKNLKKELVKRIGIRLALYIFVICSVCILPRVFGWLQNQIIVGPIEKMK